MKKAFAPIPKNFNQLKPILARKAYIMNVIKCPTQDVSLRKARIYGYWLKKEIETVKAKDNL